MRKFLFKLALFLLPFLGVMAVEALVLPVDFSTFRVWEALKIDSLKWMLPGYFYPRMKVAKIEEGDLAHHTACALKKSSYWETDRYGYRKRDQAFSAPQIVVIGDSNIAGGSLTQDDLLSEVLESTLHVPVYPLAPAHINTFFREVRFADNPPTTVIFAVVERDITTLRRLRPEILRQPGYKKELFRIEAALQTNPLVQSFGIPLDRALKNSLLFYARANLRRFMSPQTASSGPCKTMIFLQGEKANEVVPEIDFQKAVKTILSYRDALQSRGIRFIFFPIPNKETIYYDLLPAAKRPRFIPELAARLNQLGVEAIESQTLFEDARKVRGLSLYFPDDSHWDRDGVRTAAEALAACISKTAGQSASSP